MKNHLLYAPAVFLLLLLGILGNALAAAPTGTQSQKTEPERYVVVGKGTMFALHKPPGWEMDTQSDKNNGPAAVFYPSGQTWKSAQVVMYANTALNDCHTSFQSFIDYDEADFRQNSKNIIVKKLDEMMVDNLRVVIVSFSGDKYGNTEAVAYIDNAGGSFISIVLSSRTAKLFDETYPRFKELISSFQLVGNSAVCSAPKAQKQPNKT